jgi:lipopolysaccharide exporter
MIIDNRRTGIFVVYRRLSWATRRYHRFPLYDSWAGLLNVAGGQAPVLLLAAIYSPTIAGYYALAVRVLSAPIGLVGKAVSQVLLPRIVAAKRTDEAADLLERLLCILATIALPPFAIIGAIAPDIAPALFGSQWAPAGWVVSCTAIWVGWQLVCSPLSVVLVAIEAQRLNILLQASLLILRILAIFAGMLAGSAVIAILAFSIASAFGYAGYTLATGIAVGVPVRNMLMAVRRPAGLSLCLVIIVAMLPRDSSFVLYTLVVVVAGLWLWCLWDMQKRFGKTKK